MSNEISIDINEVVTKVEVTEDVTTINISPNTTTVEVRGISITNAGDSSAVAYPGQNNNDTIGFGATVQQALDDIAANALNRNKDQTIDGNITFATGHSITFPSSASTVLNLNDNSISAGSITTSSNIESSTKVKAPIFEGNLDGPLLLKAAKDSSVVLSRGDLVYAAGKNATTTLVDKANASDSTKMPAIGVVSSITNNVV